MSFKRLIPGLMVAFVALSAASEIVASPQNKRNRKDADLKAIGKRRIDKGPNFFSVDVEKKLGDESALEVARKSKIVDDPAVAAYLDRLCENLARNSDARIPVTIQMIESDEVNAFTLPGGFQFITAGLVLQTESEAELAGVLARGIAHTALRSGTRVASANQLVEYTTLPLLIFSPGGWVPTDSRSMNSLIPMGGLKAARDLEFDADYFGLQYLYKAGYDPYPVIRFLERTAPAMPPRSGTPKVFSATPPIAERVRAMTKEAAQILPPRPGAIVSSPEFDVFKEHVRSRLIPDEQRTTKAAATFATDAFSVFAAAYSAHGQFRELHPSAYGVWAPRPGFGAVYQLETGGKTESQEHVVVSAQDTLYGTGHWLETYVTTPGQSEVLATTRLVLASRDGLGTDPPIFQLLHKDSGAVLFESSTFTKMGVSVEYAFTDKQPAFDFRSQAKRIGTQSVSTPAGDFDCELWRMKKGGTEVCYSPRVAPFGVVKVTSKAGTVVLTGIVRDAKERITVIPKAAAAKEKAEGSAALYKAFPGVWKPVIGFGAAYQLETNGTKKDVEVAVVGSENRDSQTLFQLEVHAPCIGRGLEHWGYSESANTHMPPHLDIYYAADPHKGRCSNRILIGPEGLLAWVERATFKAFGFDPSGGDFNIPAMMLLPEPGNVAQGSAEARKDVTELRELTLPEATPADFRKRAVLLGTETISTAAGSFLCEHWRSHDGKTDVWLNAEVTPFGLVKKSDATGDLVLTKLITKAKSRTTGVGSSADPSKLRVELRPRQ